MPPRRARPTTAPSALAMEPDDLAPTEPAEAAPATPESKTAPPVRRRPPSRLTPDVLEAGRQAGAREGLEWLGRTPESKASLLYRVPAAGRPVLLLRRVPVPDPHVRPGAPAPRRLPADRRGASRLDGPVRRHARAPRASPAAGSSAAVHRPSHPARASVSSTVSAACCRSGAAGWAWTGTSPSARAVVGNGGVFVQMPEGTVSGPPGRIGPFRPGAALIAIRTGAPVVPLVMAGTEELYIGRRMATKVLPADERPRPAGRRLGRHAARGGEPRGARPGQGADGALRGAARPGGGGAPAGNRRPTRTPAPAPEAAHVAVPAARTAGSNRDLIRAPRARARSARHPGAAAGADRGGVATGGRGLPAAAARVAGGRVPAPLPGGGRGPGEPAARLVPGG